MPDLGTDVDAVTDLPDPEELVSGEANVGNALARRLLTPPGAYDEIGDPEPYDSIDIRQWLGKRLTTADLDDLRSQASQVLSQDERVATVAVDAQLTEKLLTLTAEGSGSKGPFRFVLPIDRLTGQLLES